MTEKLRYLVHHAYNATFAAELEGTPQEVAKQLVDAANSSIFGKPGTYPETPEFINATARLIEAVRNRERLETVNDCSLDPVCRACGNWKDTESACAQSDRAEISKLLGRSV